MEIKDNKITFEVPDDLLSRFQLALALNKKSAEALFEEWVDELYGKALNPKEERRDTFTFYSTAQVNRFLTPRPIPSGEPGSSYDPVVKRINAWAKKKDGNAYKVICAYFQAEKEHDRDHVYRRDMEKVFVWKIHNGRDLAKTETAFIQTFRQMSSSSPRAYGQIFIYRYSNNEDRVVLNRDYEALLLSLKEEFVYRERENYDN